MSTSAIYRIIRKNSIIGYLEKRGHTPARTTPDGKHFYWCPFPDHQEKNAPSFVVYTGGEFENFYCFGCGAKYHIIDLYAALEGLSKKQAFEKLGGNEESDALTESDFEIERAMKTCQEWVKLKDVTSSMMIISERCRRFLQGVNFDERETSIIDKFFKELDSVILSYEFDNIREIATWLPDYLNMRREKYTEDTSFILPEEIE